MKSFSKTKIQLQFQETNTQELQELLENSSFRNNKFQNLLKKDEIMKREIATFDKVFPLILKMRESKNAAIDFHGPQMLYKQDVDPELQKFQILTSLMLSPQTKDETTGMCMRRLIDFSIKDIAEMEFDQLKNLIFEVNFNQTKAQRIKQMAQHVMINGMPSKLEDAMAIKGVGEKIALLYMLIAFKQVLGIAVDVNMIRVCNRLGLVKDKSPSKVRQKLEQIVDRSLWGKVNKQLVGFGQQVCLPNGREKCDSCLLKNMCEFYSQKQQSLKTDKIQINYEEELDDIYLDQLTINKLKSQSSTKSKDVNDSKRERDINRSKSKSKSRIKSQQNNKNKND